MPDGKPLLRACRGPSLVALPPDWSARTRGTCWPSRAAGVGARPGRGAPTPCVHG